MIELISFRFPAPLILSFSILVYRLLREGLEIGKKTQQVASQTRDQIENQGKILIDAVNTVGGIQVNAKVANDILKEIRWKMTIEKLKYGTIMVVLLALDIFLIVLFFGCG